MKQNFPAGVIFFNKHDFRQNTEYKQIEYMKQLYNSFDEDEKPHWLSMSQILDYARQMIPSAE